MSGFKYVSEDYQNMTEQDRDIAKVRSGPIDFEKVFHYFHSESIRPLPSELARLQRMYSELSPTQCQEELMRIEFGCDEVTLDRMPSISNILTSFPPDANEKKLSDILAKLYYSFVRGAVDPQMSVYK